MSIAPAPSPAPAKPPTTAQPTVNPPTVEEIQAAGKMMVDKLFGPEPAPAAPVTAPPPEPAPAAVAPPPAPVTPPPPAAPPAAAPETQPVSLETIQRTARMAADLVADRLVPAPAPEPVPQPTLDLSPEDAADLKILRYMAESDPKLAGLPEAFLAFVKKAYAYQDAWQEANKNETFKWEDAEHAKWYEDNAPEINREAMDEAKADMRAEEKWRQKMEPIEREKREVEAWEKARPKVNDRVNYLLVTMVDAARPELGKVLRDANGQPDLRPEAVAKAQELDPIASDILEEELMIVMPLLAELEKTGVPGLNYRLNPNANPVHAAISHFVAEAERSILSSPAEEQIFNGKQFTPIAEMQRLREKVWNGLGSNEQKNQKIADLESTRTTLSIDDVQEIIRDDFATRAKAKIDRKDAVAKKKYGKNGNGAQVLPPENRQPATEPAPSAAPPKPAPVVQPLRPPSISSESDALTTGNPSAGPAKTFGEGIAATLWK